MWSFNIPDRGKESDEGRRTRVLLLLSQHIAQTLGSLLQVILLLLHVLNGLVTLAQERLESPNLLQKTAADLKGKLCWKSIKRGAG